MDISKTLLFQKIQKSNTIVFADFDGTVFAAGSTIVTAPFYNVQTKKILNQKDIPLIFVTGRADWPIKAEIETNLFALPKADAIIAGAGTIMYYRLPNGELEIDKQWKQNMQESTITWKQGAKEQWNREKIQNTIKKITDIPFTILPLTSDKHLVRLHVCSLPIDKLHSLTNNINSLFSVGVKVLITEKLLQPNSLTTFSGNILILPEKAGKDLAVIHILETFYKLDARRSSLDALIFGDASVDVPMLTLKSTKAYAINTFGVNLTPLARKVLEEEQKENPQLHILNVDGPMAMLKVMKQLIQNGRNFPFSSQEKVAVRPDEVRESYSIEIFTPAQNSFVRRMIEPFEPVLDRILEKQLSPNEISLLGLDMARNGIDTLYGEKNITFSQKITAIKQYFFGHFIDLLDGIRYRQDKKVSPVFPSPFRRRPRRDVPYGTSRSGGEVRESQDFPNAQTLPGQLVDVYCDRVKEFYQLYKRALFRRTYLNESTSLQKDQLYQTLLSAMSCILPSIARAQAELSGTIVKERDPKGGSMFARTKKLFFSLLADTFGFQNKSLSIDQNIYQSNMATFHNRLRHCEKRGTSDAARSALPTFNEIASPFDKLRVRNDVLSELQKKGQERFLFVIQLLQEENDIVEKELKNYPEFAEKYKKEFKRDIESYLKLDVEILRRKWKIKDVNLHLEL